MRLAVNKSVSKLVGIWSFLLLLIFKGIFPQSAYAFLSSLDACAAQPECAAAVGSELSPTIAAPTAEATGTTAISTTTAAGATSSSVEAVAGTTVVGDMRLSGVAAYYIWNKAQNQKAQNKAKEKYCTIYPTDIEVCAGWTFAGNGIQISDCSKQNINYFGNSLSEPQFIPINNFHTYCSGVGVLVDGQRFGGDGYAYFPGTEIKVRNSEKEWKDWPQEKRDAAVQLLNSSDWQGLITSMPAGGVLNPGDKVNAPTIIIPGQETDDPNTPADERILKKQPGFFINPPDFDYDREPDESDVDDDDDGTPDYSDPEPQNPLVPEASSDTSNPPPDQPQNPLRTTPEPGVGGNGTASEFGDMTGISLPYADAFLRSLGATVKTTAGGYTQYKFPDRSEVWIRPDGEVVRTPAPRYGADGSRINKGARLDQNGNLTNPPNHNTGERLRN